MGTANAPCLVHLARRANGLDPFERFLQSYRNHDPGISHSLAIVLKGFSDRDATEPYHALASDVCDTWLEVSDDGFDIDAFRQAANQLPHKTLVFINSFTVISQYRWLDLMASIARSRGVGAVGATGSWASQALSERYLFGFGLGVPYRRMFPDRAATKQMLGEITPPPPQQVSPIRKALLDARSAFNHSVVYPSFPNPHLRTNCMWIDRDVWLQVCPAEKLTSKAAAHAFESGRRRGMTRRLKRRDLRVVVAGRDGRAYEVAEWAASRTFWQGNQENLLIEDNQTRTYRDAKPELRRVLSGFAWGPEADPS